MNLRVTDLGCVRSGRSVLSGVDLDVAPGQALLLRGPNGAGKSTLLRVLAGLLAPASGDAVLGGVSLAADPETYAEALAYCGHLDSIKPQLTIAENLRFWAGLFNGDGFDAAVAAFDLGPLLDRPAHACSAGQKRRAGLARLLLARRSLWLLDEPTVSLDTTAVAQVCAAVRAHCAGGGMAVIATHLPLDLSDPRELRLDPLGTAARTSRDPFLTGAWT
jgi:heme exporter protein A